MLNLDPVEQLAAHRHELLKEAERARLIALLPHRPSPLRRALALGCVRLANWLDREPGQYLQSADSGREDWVTPLAST